MRAKWTDLAMEARGSVPVSDVRLISGIERTVVRIEDEQTARELGRPRGTYVTLSCPQTMTIELSMREALSWELAQAIRQMLPEHARTVLVTGLGNRSVTPDSLGPATIDKTLVTRHLLSGDYARSGLKSVCAIAPGVLGVTGVETVEMVESLAHKLHPRAILCIDSLAARDSGRIGCTIQITNTGIQPGSGVGNHRKALTQDTLGVEVIAVGVPTVVYAATLARDAFALLATPEDDSGEEALASMERELLGTELGNLIVTPRDIDAIVKDCATLIAGGINRALQPSLSDAEIAQMMD